MQHIIWNKSLCTVKQKVMAKMSCITTLHSILLLHHFSLCPLCSLAERWAIFWRGTQLNKMIPHQQTERGATLKDKDSLRICVCLSVYVPV